MLNAMVKRWVKTRIHSAFYGITLPFAAAKLIFSRPALLFWSLLPVTITLSLYGVVVLKLQTYAKDTLTHFFIAHGLSPEGWGAWFALLLLKLLLFLIGAVTFSLVATVVASPFNDFLAEASERYASPPLASVGKTRAGAKFRLIMIDLSKTIAATACTLAAILFSGLPLLNFIAFLIAFLLVTFQFISYPQTRRGIGIGGGLAFLWRHLYACAGFGAAISLLFALPIVSALSVPLAVVGGTLLVARGQLKDPALK